MLLAYFLDLFSAFQTRQCLDTVYKYLVMKKCLVLKVDASCEINARLQFLDQFKSGKEPMAICSDAWSRAIDVPSVKVIINYDLPCHSTNKNVDKKRYIYRMGRASRFGWFYRLESNLSMLTIAYFNFTLPQVDRQKF